MKLEEDEDEAANLTQYSVRYALYLTLQVLVELIIIARN